MHDCTGKNILNNFKKILGQYCAINQFIELSKRCFVLDHEEGMKNRENFIDLATCHSITLTDYNAENMINAISISYIVNVNLCFETFLKDACAQVRKYGKRRYQDKSQDAPILQKNAWKKYTRERCKKAIFAYINTLFKLDDTLDEKN